MPEPSTTAGNDQPKGDATADSTTAADSTKTATDQQTAKTGDNLDASKSTDTSGAADGDKKPADDNTKSQDDKTPVSKFDDDIDDWIDKKGYPKPTTEAEKLAFQNERNASREFTRERQAQSDAKALDSTVKDAKAEIKTDKDADDDSIDPLEKRQNALEERYEAERTTRLQSEFYRENKVTPEEHSAIMDVLKEKLNRPTTDEGKKAALDVWASPDALPDLLDLAKARIAGSTDTTGMAEEAARKERERIAQESQANSTNRSAKATSTGNKSPEEERTERLLGKYS